MNEIEKIIVPGFYTGEGRTDPTFNYPNGTIIKVKSDKIRKDTKDEKLEVKIEGTSYDAKTKKKLFDYTKIVYFYKDSNDKSRYIYEGKIYQDGKIKSSAYGYVSRINPKLKTMTVKLVFSYFITTNVIYTKSSIFFKRDSKEKTLLTLFKNDEKHKGEKNHVHFNVKYFQRS